MPSFTSPTVVIRPALPSDAADVLEFTKFIWDGDDYINKYVWRDWLADPHGILAVGQYGPHAVALGKISRVGAGQWWMEGVRVDPRYQGLKIGTRMFEYLQDWWREHGGGTLRLMTSSERVQMHHLCERFGWTKLGEVKTYRAPVASGSHAFRPVSASETPAALDFARDKLAPYGGLMDVGWVFGVPEPDVFERLQRAGWLYWWGDGERRGLTSAWKDDEDGRKILVVGFMGCDLRSLKDMLMAAQRLAGERGFDCVEWLAPAVPAVESILVDAGYESVWDGSAFLYGIEA